MVMIFFCGIQYEIYLDGPVDFYNDILPIWIEVREKIKFEPVNDIFTGEKVKNMTKLIVLEESKLHKRFKKNLYADTYLKCHYPSLSYCESEIKDLERIKFYDVKNYNLFVKNNKNLPNPFTPDEFHILKNKLDGLTKKLDNHKNNVEFVNEHQYTEIINEMYTLMPIYKLQRIIYQPNYFEEIKSIEKSLTEIELMQNEQDLINKIINHPNIKNFIHSHGIYFVEGYY